MGALRAGAMQSCCHVLFCRTPTHQALFAIPARSAQASCSASYALTDCGQITSRNMSSSCP
eukprot:13666159-Alexandrium_andersonii.AAC.1